MSGFFKKLGKAAADAASTATDAVTNTATGTFNAAADVTKQAHELAASITSGAVNMADVRHLLRFLETVPPLHDATVDKALLDASLAVMQMGNTTVLMTYDKTLGAEASVVNMDRISIRKANEIAGREQFTSVVISKGASEDEPNIHLVFNVDNFQDNHRHLTSDLIVQGLLIPVENIPVVGGVVAGIIEYPCKLIGRFIVNTVFEQAERVSALAVGRKDSPEAPTEPKPAP